MRGMRSKALDRDPTTARGCVFKRLFARINLSPSSRLDGHDIFETVLTRRNREVVDCKRYRVKNYSKLTNFRKFTRIEGYNGKYGSNP